MLTITEHSSNFEAVIPDSRSESNFHQRSLSFSFRDSIANIEVQRVLEGLFD